MSHIFAVSSAFFILSSLIDLKFNLHLNEPKTMIFRPQVQKFHNILLLTTCPIWGLFPRPLWMHFFTVFYAVCFPDHALPGATSIPKYRRIHPQEKMRHFHQLGPTVPAPSELPQPLLGLFLGRSVCSFFDRCVLMSGMFVPKGIEIRTQEHMLHLHQLGFGTFPRVKRPSGRVSNTSWAHSMWN